ncbi:pilus assembly protein [Thermodesulfobacteriota bacterium]
MLTVKVSVNGDELYGILGEHVRMYQSSYSTDGWIGDVKAYQLDQATGEVITTAPVFSAAEALQDKGWSSRVIATYDGTDGIPFRVDSLTDQQRAMLLDSNWMTSGVTYADVVDYLRGDNSKEVIQGGEFRNRHQMLGDIVHSSPQFTNNVLYAGGNDGILHAFSAETGQEIFGYIPNQVFENLNKLANPSYSHMFYVDLTPVTRKIEYTDGNGDTQSPTILVGGLAKGGKGYYCLDISGVTNSSVVSETELADMVMWEYPRSGVSEVDTDDLGFSFSKPAIIQSYDNNYPWVLIFGNGYNSMNSHAVLFIMDPVTGNLLKKLDTGIVASGTQCNGLSSPIAIDHNYDGKVDYVYAGDLYGNMWKFDLTDSDYQNWEVAYGVDTNNDTEINYYEADGAGADVPKPLFTARGPLDLPQPITTKPDVIKHCEKHGFMVVFGTGRYLGETDFLNDDVQTIYGIWDYGDDVDDSEYVGTFQRAAAQRLSNLPDDVDLVQQTQIGGAVTTASGQPIRILTNHAPLWSTVPDSDADQEENPGKPDTCTNLTDDDNDGDIDALDDDECPEHHVGWHVDVPAGERVANDLLIREGKVVMIGFVPEQTPCGSGGNSIIMELDACSGGRLTEPQLDINQDGVIDSSDLVTVTIDGEEVTVAPTGIEYEGRLMPPAILRDKDEEIKYFSTNVGSIVTLREKAVSLGMTYWLEFE